MAAAAVEGPELSALQVHDTGVGLRIRILSSDAQRDGLLVSVVRDPQESGGEPDGLDFETSRAARAQAAIDVRRLDRVHGGTASEAEPPSGWSSA